MIDKFNRELDNQVFEIIHKREVVWGDDHVPFYSCDWLHMRHYLLNWLYGLKDKHVMIKTVITESETYLDLRIGDKLSGIVVESSQVEETFPVALCKAVVALKRVLK